MGYDMCDRNENSREYQRRYRWLKTNWNTINTTYLHFTMA